MKNKQAFICTGRLIEFTQVLIQSDAKTTATEGSDTSTPAWPGSIPITPQPAQHRTDCNTTSNCPTRMSSTAGCTTLFPMHGWVTHREITASFLTSASKGAPTHTASQWRHGKEPLLTPGVPLFGSLGCTARTEHFRKIIFLTLACAKSSLNWS